MFVLHRQLSCIFFYCNSIDPDMKNKFAKFIPTHEISNMQSLTALLFFFVAHFCNCLDQYKSERWPNSLHYTAKIHHIHSRQCEMWKGVVLYVKGPTRRCNNSRTTCAKRHTAGKETRVGGMKVN